MNFLVITNAFLAVADFSSKTIKCQAGSQSAILEILAGPGEWELR